MMEWQASAAIRTTAHEQCWLNPSPDCECNWVIGQALSVGEPDMLIASQPLWKWLFVWSRLPRNEDRSLPELLGIKSLVTIANSDFNNKGFNDQIANYTNQVNTLTGQYQNALKTAEANAQARDQFESQFKQASADYKRRAEADQYREEAVGQQLRAVRSGSTVGGANQSQNLTGGLYFWSNRLQQ